MFRQSPKSKVVCRKIESDMAITFSSDTSIFEPRERESLKTNQYLRPYAAITKPQLAGLLSALGEYVVRAEGYQPEVMGSTYSSWDSSRIGSILLFNDRNRYKNNLAKQRDVIAEPIDPRVGITNREIRVDSGENIIH
jgi:hypothetical protein